jgi:LPXTG-motif cell wall-anchored protein
MKKTLAILIALVVALTLVNAITPAFATETTATEITRCGEASLVYFTINDEVVYCVDYDKLAPETGTLYEEVDPGIRDLSVLDDVYINISTSEAEKDEVFFKVAQQAIWATLNPARNCRAIVQRFLGNTAAALFDELLEAPEGEFSIAYKAFKTADKNYQVMANASVMEIVPEVSEEPKEELPAPEPETIPETAPETEVVDPEPETTEVVTEPETEVIIEEPEVEVVPVPETEPATEPVTVPVPEPEVEPETTEVVEPEVEVVPEPETEVVTELETVPAEPETEPEVEVLGEEISKEEVLEEEIPQTGDGANLAALAAMVMLSGGAVVALTRKKETFN